MHFHLICAFSSQLNFAFPLLRPLPYYPTQLLLWVGLLSEFDKDNLWQGAGRLFGWSVSCCARNGLHLRKFGLMDFECEKLSKLVFLKTFFRRKLNNLKNHRTTYHQGTEIRKVFIKHDLFNKL